jgi:alpha-galactosidase
MKRKSYWWLLLGAFLHSPTLKAQNSDSLDNSIRTPAPSPKPRINGSMVFGVRPEHPIVYHIAVSGDRPMRVHVTGLPEGVSFQAADHSLSGKIKKPGRYALHITATNKYGSVQKTLVLKVGETIALTPPMGWNSWNI